MIAPILNKEQWIYIREQIYILLNSSFEEKDTPKVKQKIIKIFERNLDNPKLYEEFIAEFAEKCFNLPENFLN